MTYTRQIKYIDATMELLNPVLESIMATETKRLNGVLNDLLIRNSHLGGNKSAFIHLGKIYCLIPRKYLRNEKIGTIHPSLQGEAEGLRKLREKLEQDTVRLRQSLAVVAVRCKHKQGLRDALPETLVAALPDFQGMERIEEEGYLLNEHPLLKRQYDQAVEIALYYQANSLLY